MEIPGRRLTRGMAFILSRCRTRHPQKTFAHNHPARVANRYRRDPTARHDVPLASYIRSAFQHVDMFDEHWPRGLKRGIGPHLLRRNRCWLSSANISISICEFKQSKTYWAQDRRSKRLGAQDRT